MIEELIRKISGYLDKAEIPYMIIGGQAVLLYGTPRLTRDIDITMGIDTDKFSLVKKVCGDSGLKILSEHPESFAIETKVLPAEDTKSRIRVDFIFSFSPYEKKAIGRAKGVVMHGYSVKFASCEDVIIHKMVAGRAVDEEDVKNMLIKNRDQIDLEYVGRWLSEFSRLADHRGISENFNKLLKEVWH